MRQLQNKIISLKLNEGQVNYLIVTRRAINTSCQKMFPTRYEVDNFLWQIDPYRLFLYNIN